MQLSLDPVELKEAVDSVSDEEAKKVAIAAETSRKKLQQLSVLISKLPERQRQAIEFVLHNEIAAIYIALSEKAIEQVDRQA